MVASAFWDVKVVGVFEGRDDGRANGGSGAIVVTLVGGVALGAPIAAAR
jgi:hypothetical protein